MKKQLLALGAALLITAPQINAAAAAAAASTALMTVSIVSAAAIMDLLAAIERNAPANVIAKLAASLTESDLAQAIHYAASIGNKEIAAQLTTHKIAAAPREFHEDAPARPASVRRDPPAGAGHGRIQQPARRSGH